MHIKLFGTFAVTSDSGEPIQIAGSKSQALVAYLALNMDLPPSRDRLMALFWGDRFTEQARQSLRQAISKLRRTFPAEALIANEDRVAFNPEHVTVDAEQFHAAAKSGDEAQSAQAIDLLAGQLLDGIFGRSAEFDDWLAAERARTNTVAGDLFERVAENHLRANRLSDALAVARRLITLDPMRDRSQALLIRILAQSGERANAIKHFNAYEEQLKAELGVGAGPDLRKLVDEIRSETFTSTPQVAAEVGPSPRAANMPVEPVSDMGRPSIAVATFTAFSDDADENLFAETITEDISANLSRFRWLEVFASVEPGGPRLNVARMRELHDANAIAYLLHGTLRVLGGRLRMTVQLAEARTGRFLWVERYNRTGDDIFAIQDELAETIAASVENELEKAAGRDSAEMQLEDMSAWACYHRGLAIQYEFSAETNSDAQRYFRRAIELDPGFAAAYARLAYAMVISAIYFGAERVSELLDEALELARTGARLDPDDAVARFALGRVHLARGEYDRSVTELGTAIELNPGLAQAHCGLGDSLAYSGKLEEAMECFNEAVRISPSDPYRWAFLSYGATALLFQGDYEKAVDWAYRAESVPNAHFWATAIRTSALAHLGRHDEATEALTELKRRHPGITCAYVRDRLFYLRDPAQIETYITGLAKAGLA